MPVSDDVQRRLLLHYKIDSLNPESWPHQEEGNDADDSDDENPLKDRSAAERRAHYSRHASVLSNSYAAPNPAVLQDEPDPLGLKSSIAMELSNRGLPLDHNPAFRNRFMLTSTSFSPALFLSQVHQDDSMEDLLEGLDRLSASIQQKSASLKVLVESNFEKFVRAKATIDNVYTEMRGQRGEETTPVQPASPFAKGHSRHSSKTHFRSTSGSFGVNKAPPPTDRRKNALTKESDYGTQGIKAPLVDVAIKAEEVWGPILGGREKEETMKSAVSVLDQHREIFRLPSLLAESIRRNDYDGIVDLHKSAKRHTETARNIAQVAKENGITTLDERDAQQIIVTAKMWHDVQERTAAFKRSVWHRLKNLHGRPSSTTDGDLKEEHMLLIGVILQLGVDPEENNPIWEYLRSQCLYLKNKFTKTYERARNDIEGLRRKLVRSGEQTDPTQLARFLRSIESQNSESGLDSPAILRFWEKVYASLNSLLSTSNGVVSEFVEFWDVAQSFIDNKAQKSFPTPVWFAGLEHLELEPDDVLNLRQGAIQLLDQIREALLAFFTDPPGGPVSGEAWDNFAFWPPRANSLSCLRYLSQITTLIGTAASELSGLSVISQSRPQIEALRTLVTTVRERCTAVVCSTWASDAERCMVLEVWRRNPDRREITTFPTLFNTFQDRVITDLSKIAYISDASSKPDIIHPPSSKLLLNIRNSFVTCLCSSFESMVENAQREHDVSDVSEIDAHDKNIRMLLTLSNLSYMRTNEVPQLISQFETAFSLTLTEESKTIHNSLTSHDTQLFQAYIEPTISKLSEIISTAIQSRDWEPAPDSRPQNAKPYVYDVLLALVLVHSDVSTTASALIPRVLSHLLEHACLALLSAFQGRKARYSLPALMQATLDVEFMAQSLNLYTTDRAGEVQSQIYLALDERTDNDARANLQGELPEMRAVLKRLREGTKGEFACFKRERRGRDRGDSGKGRG